MQNANWQHVVEYNRHAGNLTLGDTIELWSIVDDSENFDEMRTRLRNFVSERGFSEKVADTTGFFEWLEIKEGN